MEGTSRDDECERGDELDRLIAATAANHSSDETSDDDGMVYGFNDRL